MIKDQESNPKNRGYSETSMDARQFEASEPAGEYSGDFLQTDSSYNSAKRIEKSVTYAIRHKR